MNLIKKIRRSEKQILSGRYVAALVSMSEEEIETLLSKK
tara:strand:+ start:380 stop:496 length:117 start_codon:yes stop_codon:yes gene_type:complete